MAGRRNRWLPWLFVGPALFLLFVFLVYPTFQTILLSFTKGTILNPGREFVGLANFERLLTADRTFLRLDEWPPSGVLPNTALWVLLFPPATVGIGLLIAVLADRVRYEAALKSVIFLPMVISSTAASVIFVFVYSPDLTKGVLNAALTAIIPNMEPITWLGRKELANLAIIFAAVWVSAGLPTVVLSAAYKGLPREILEAARVDGGNPWQIFWRVSLPMMAKPITFVTIMLTINALKMVDLVLVMTNGGPRGATRVIGYTVWQEIFGNNRVGYGSAVAVILFILVAPAIIYQIRQVRAEIS
jgi:alpha-glucoside transport system permease protein